MEREKILELLSKTGMTPEAQLDRLRRAIEIIENGDDDEIDATLTYPIDQTDVVVGWILDEYKGKITASHRKVMDEIRPRRLPPR